MEPGSTNLTEAVRSVQHLKIEGYSAARTLSSSDCIKSTWNVGGYDWEVCFYHEYTNKYYNEPMTHWVTLKLVFLSSVPPARKVRANLGCRLVDPSQNLEPTEMENGHDAFCSAGDCSPQLFLLRSDNVPSSGYLKNDSLTVECTITVLKQLPKIVIPCEMDVPLPVPPSDLHQHLGELLQNQKGGDVTFLFGSGERFLAHKCILAARSHVFMAEFFGQMDERNSQSVQIEGVEPAAFKAMLHFIYTDTVTELDDEETEKAVIMAQHLLAAADRYGLDRLKLICEAKLSSCIEVGTAAATLALAEQHSCSLLKAKCVEFVTASPEKLDAVLATEGYKHLVASCPQVLAELLKAARGMRT